MGWAIRGLLELHQESKTYFQLHFGFFHKAKAGCLKHIFNHQYHVSENWFGLEHLRMTGNGSQILSLWMGHIGWMTEATQRNKDLNSLEVSDATEYFCWSLSSCLDTQMCILPVAGWYHLAAAYRSLSRWAEMAWIQLPCWHQGLSIIFLCSCSSSISAAQTAFSNDKINSATDTSKHHSDLSASCLLLYWKGVGHR